MAASNDQASESHCVSAQFCLALPVAAPLGRIVFRLLKQNLPIRLTSYTTMPPLGFWQKFKQIFRFI